MFKVLGKGVISGLILVIVATVMLPSMFKLLESKPEVIADGEKKVSFSDLLQPKNGNFNLEIDKLGVNSAIVANVDPSEKLEYEEALENGVAHAKGTYLPGVGGGVTIFAHSTDDDAVAQAQNAVFYRLDELKKGDKIQVSYLDKEYEYEVYRSWVTVKDDVGMFKKIKNGERLFLMTCTPRGTTDKRLIVEAKLVDSR